ncbi:MAG: ACP phosphodiesterase [Crocinitomicaceae bacterium]
MNYLAHAYLSFESKPLLFGNFIGDFVKGSKNKDFPEEVWNGVVLHREIDHFTDNHASTIYAKDLIRSELGLASGIFIDMVFDHVLANKWSTYSELILKEFSSGTYMKLEEYAEYFPQKFQYMFNYMKKDDWLSKYQSEIYMERFLSGVSRRLKVDNELDGSFNLYKKNQEEINQCFHELFDELIILSKTFAN